MSLKIKLGWTRRGASTQVCDRKVVKYIIILSLMINLVELIGGASTQVSDREVVKYIIILGQNHCH